MDARKYVIADIEATGLGEDKEIIEVALITYQEGKIIDVYQTLVNPLVTVSEFVTDLTQISRRQLNEAPKFYEVAEAIIHRLEGAILVSHNIDFDYELLKKKFNELDRSLELKTFCTLKISQETVPGLKSYSLDSLCQFFEIKNNDRHRALGDAYAALEIFKTLQNLRLPKREKIYYLPQHEKDFKKISSRAGLLYFKNEQGKVIRLETAFNMEKKARELLEVCLENRDLLKECVSVEGEATGSALIAEFKKDRFHPMRYEWILTTEVKQFGKKFFSLQKFHPSLKGWAFKDKKEAERKLKDLIRQIPKSQFAYREGAPSKEEVFAHNQAVDKLLKEATLPSENLVIFGEGRSPGERTFILVREGDVVGFGHTDHELDQILEGPEKYITGRPTQKIQARNQVIHYLKILKNLRHKTDSWRELPQKN
jgi:DNA polymerase-3 subunit epsilon